MNNLYMFEVNWKRGAAERAGHYLPYSTGTIWAFAKQNPLVADNFQLADFIFQRHPIPKLLDQLVDPDICAFSSYVWNLEYNLEASKAIKKRWPNCQIIFGGPAVDEVAFNFLARNPWVDTVITGEGEFLFTDYLTDYYNNTIKKTYSGERIKNLELPSPYLNGVFDGVLAKYPNFRWSMSLETNRGCPFACTFCDWGSSTQSKVNRFGLEKVFAEIEWAGRNHVDFIYITDANFGIFYERDLEIARCLVETKKKYGYPLLMETNYYKNSTKKVLDIIKVLEDGGLIAGLTLSVQSQSEKVLDAIKRRNMEISSLTDIVSACKQRNIPYYTEFILPLPEETLESWREGLCSIIEGGFKETIMIYPAEVLINSELAKQREQYGLTIEVYQGMREGDDSGVKEKHRYAMATNTMSRTELAEAWHYGYMVSVFHGWGWTQAVADFVRAYSGQSYRTTYDSLIAHLSTSAWFREELDALSKTLEVKDDSERIKLDVHLASFNFKYHQNRKVTFEQLLPWYKEMLKDCPDALAEAVLQYQYELPVNINYPKGVEFACAYNVQEYLYDNQELTATLTKYRAMPRAQWTDDNEFQLFILYRLYQGFPRSRISKVVDN